MHYYIQLFTVLLFAGSLSAQTVTPWLTRGNQSVLLTAQSTVSFGADGGSANVTVDLDLSTTYQSIAGFGFCLTQGSAEVINGLSAGSRAAVLDELFGPTGLQISAVRISIGASDLSGSLYTYNETPGDVNMDNFSLAGPDLAHVIPVLRDILAINPAIKVLATPWTAPTWMKTNGDWVGGSLDPTYYAAYATYFIKYLQAMATEGVDIWAITPQNEPENPFNEPSMLMTAAEQTDFINNHLGPALGSAGLNPRIIAFDHNCDNPGYPTYVLNNSSYVEGAAFHLYAGDISAMTQVREATGKNVYFTEQYTDSNGNFSNDFSWHLRNVLIGSLNNWSRAVFEWNLATDANYGPRQPGGCSTCLGALTISGPDSYTRNVSYYIIGQAAKFIQPGAVRVGLTSNSTQVHTTALLNPDGSVALIAYNERNNNQNLKVVDGTQSFIYTIPSKSAVTFVWTANAQPTAPVAPTNLAATTQSASSIALNWTDASDNESGFQIERSPDGTSGWQVIASPGQNTTNYTDSGLSPTTTYFYRIRATNGTGDSGWSNIASATTQAGSGGLNGIYNVLARHSNKGLDVANLATNNNANVQQWEVQNGGGTNQQWSLAPLAGTSYYTLTAQHSGLCLAIERRNSNNVVQKSCDGGAAQSWDLLDLGNGYYRILNASNGRALSVANADLTNGANVETAATGGGSEQEWALFLLAALRPMPENYDVYFDDPADQLTLSPNPARSHVLLGRTGMRKQSVSIEIFGIDGRRIWHGVREWGADAPARIELAGIPAGVYYVRAHPRDGATLPIARLVIERR